MGMKICQIGCVSKLVGGGVFLRRLQSGTFILGPLLAQTSDTCLNIGQILACQKWEGGGGNFGPILQSGRFIILVSKISIFAYVLLVF